MRSRSSRFIAALALLSASVIAQTAPGRARQAVGKISLDTSPALFATLATLDHCGYDAEQAGSDPLRGSIRKHVSALVSASADAQVAEARICQFIREHQQPEKSKELAQYVSLAMNISGPPFELKGKEADLPPDASNVAGFVPGLQTFFEAAHLARVWNKYQPAYEQRLDALHEPLAKMLLATDLYLRLPQSSYLGREFVIYVDPQLPPGQVNARNYASDYFVAVSPARVGSHMDEIRHTYLHFVLDPLLLKRANQVKKLEPILQSISDAPMDQSYKQDASLLVTESLIRAVEARLLPATGDAKQTEGARSGRAEDSMKQGFVLTRYFYDQLAQFEKDTTGIRDAFPDMLYSMDVDRERKRAEQTQFASAASSEVLGSGATAQPKLLDIAEAKLAANDVQAARRIAQQVIDEKTPGEDPSRALFVLARTAALSRDVDAAQAMFERTLEIAKEPRIVAWSHISLGRIFDLKCERDQAVTHYRAALSAGDATPETQAAAKRGIDTSPPAGRCTGDSN